MLVVNVIIAFWVIKMLRKWDRADSIKPEVKRVVRPPVKITLPEAKIVLAKDGTPMLSY